MSYKIAIQSFFFIPPQEFASGSIFYWPQVSIRDRIEMVRVQLLTWHYFDVDSRGRGEGKTDNLCDTRQVAQDKRESEREREREKP